MSEKYTNIGSISFFINDSKEHDITDDEVASLGKIIGEHYAELFAKSELLSCVKVSGIDARRGCIIITIHLAVALAVGGPATGILILTKYKKIRDNIILASQDLDKLRKKLRETFPKGRGLWFYRDDLDQDRDKRDDNEG